MQTLDEKRRIYLDHAATSYPKPPKVLEAVHHYLKDLGASAGRGAYREAFLAKEILEDTRKKVCQIFNGGPSERLVFTLNATDALNMALKGLLRPGDHVVTSSIEHNSMARPLYALKQMRDVSFTRIFVNVEGEVDFHAFEKAIRPRTKLIAFLHGSNVSGTLSPIAEIGERARRHGIPLLVDAAQTLGSYPLDVEAMKIDLLAFPGHKGLLGPLGTGGLWVREGLELSPLREGGTGSFSEEDSQPLHWPDRHESGSHNLIGLVGLRAAAEFLLNTGIEKIRQRKLNLLERLISGLYKIPGLHVIAPKSIRNNAGVVSLQLTHKSPQEVALQLDEAFRIQVRPGLHCAPWAHESFGTLSPGATLSQGGALAQGTLRLSVGYSNTEEEIAHTLTALRQRLRA